MADGRPWFRLYTEFAFDPKVQLLDETLQRRYVMLLCAAAGGMSPFHGVSEAAFLLRIPVSECEETRSILVSRGLITDDWFPVAWDKRQFESDTSTSRVKRFRQRQRAATQVVTETPSEQSRTEQIQNRTEKRGKRACAPPPQTDFDPTSVTGLDQQAWALWIEHRSAIRKPIRPHSLRDAADGLVKLGPNQLAEVKRARAGGWQGLHPEKVNGKGHHAPSATPYAKSPAELENEAIENGITAGKSDREILAEINSEFVSIDDIQRKREELQHAQH